jgi:23S rRNA (uracil1939-C5)-methyltransferase
MVLLDPPRQGIYKGMVPLKNIAPKTIVYVSCDPTTLARDLGYLCRGDEYKLNKVVALDFFPNTYHIESVAFLERNPTFR